MLARRLTVAASLMAASDGEARAQAAAAEPTKTGSTPTQMQGVRAVAAKKTDEQIVVQARRRTRLQVLQSGEMGALGDMKAIDTPFTIRSYTSSLILNQQSETLGQVLENDPAVRVTDGFGNFSEIFVIRGFPLDSDDVGIDGLYGIAPRQTVSPELYDQVQVLLGASAFLNGAAPAGTGIGGGVNLTMKEAPDTPLMRVTGDYVSSSLGGGAIDLGRRFGTDNAWGVRLNIGGNKGYDSVDNERRDDFVLGAAIDYRGEKLRVGLDLDYQMKAIYGGQPEIVPIDSPITGFVPSTPNPSHNYGEPFIYSRLRDVFGILHADYDLTDNIDLYGAAGAKNGTEYGDYSLLYVENPAGDASGSQLYVPATTDNESVRGGMRIHLATGPVHHTLNVGASGLWEVFRTAYEYSDDYNTNIYNTPVVAAPALLYSAGTNNDPKPTSETQLYSAWFSDTAKFFDDRFELIAGFRWQEIANTQYLYTGPVQSKYDQTAITPVVGVVFHPTKDTAIYFNRIEGLAEGPTAPEGTTNFGEVFAPYTSVQYEVGAKYIRPRFSAGVAVYQIGEPEAYSQTNPDGTQTYVENGNQRDRGVEFNLSGEPLRGVRLIGGVSINDAELMDTAGGTENGNGAIGVPTYTLNGNAEWDLPWVLGATLTGRVIRTGPQEVFADNALSIPGWTRFDVGARYTFPIWHKPVTARLGVDNVTDARFWQSAYNSYLLEGLPRTYKFSLSVDF